MILTLYIMRHGQSTGNLISQFQSVLDTELTDLGYQQARKLKGSISVPVVYHSPLKRASETAKTIFEGDAELIVIDDLIEEDVGIFVGKLYPELSTAELEIWDKAVKNLDYLGHEGESRNQIKKRGNRVMKQIVIDMQKRVVNKAAIVSHGGILKTFLKQHIDTDMTLGNCEPVIVKYDTTEENFFI
ncbi:MAG: histidine phosphatase family protein [Candidatus Heimdallarchaeota archaeon]|nr:histidine phosphatase family protein [Candidatus Heimdallarchaeota archaeon]MCK5049809.1 histidine phosphatase family protein [Candidatus Heimdallarchaeota archaeon]